MARRVAVTGAAGQLGRQLVRAFREAGGNVLPLSRAEFDLEHPDPRSLIAWSPDVVVNAAAWTDVDGCARDPQRAMQLNSVAAAVVAEAAARIGAQVIQLSTNEVFDGTLDRPYREDDRPNPINPYGASKLAGEQAVMSANPHHLVVRTAWLFGPGGTNFVTKILAAANRLRTPEDPLRVVDDEWGNPTWTPSLAEAIVALSAPDAPRGIVHVVGTPPATRFSWARLTLEAASMSIRIEPISSTEFVRASNVPPHAVLAPTAGLAPIDWAAATVGYAAALAARDISGTSGPR